MRWAATCAALGTIAGCSGASDGHEVVRSSAEAIVGGKDDFGDPAVGALRYWFVDACTATLIAPHTALTAAHCTKTIAEDVGADATLELHFGIDSGDKKKADVAAHVEHPKFTKAGAGYDVAVLRLASAVDDIPPVPISMGKTPDLTDVWVRHVGFGDNVEDANGKTSGQGRKREATYAVHKVEPLLYWSGAGTFGQTCEGDSGGPMLWRDPSNTERIVAVVSDGPNCHDDGADARIDVDDVRSFILDQIQKNDPGFVMAPGPPAGTSGDSDDGGPSVPPEPASGDSGPDGAPSPAAPSDPAATPGARRSRPAEEPARAEPAAGCSAGPRAPAQGAPWPFVLASLTLLGVSHARCRRRIARNTR